MLLRKIPGFFLGITLGGLILTNTVQGSVLSLEVLPPELGPIHRGFVKQIETTTLDEDSLQASDSRSTKGKKGKGKDKAKSKVKSKGKARAKSKLQSKNKSKIKSKNKSKGKRKAKQKKHSSSRTQRPHDSGLFMGGSSESEGETDAEPFWTFREDEEGIVTYDFHVMAQGKYPTSRQLSCMSRKSSGCHGVARLMPTGAEEEAAIVKTFPMPEKDLYVGRTVFEGLAPSTTYEVQVGYRKGDFREYEGEAQRALEWNRVPFFSIATPPEKPGERSSFLYGSCAWIGKAGPLVIWQDKVDEIFDSMKRDIHFQAKSGSRTDAVITLGDTPYMDGTGKFLAAKNTEEMYKHVRLLYGTKGARQLMAQGPFHQVRDDHEWWNDSTAEFSAKKQKRANAAQHIYNLFQRPQGAETPHTYQILEGNLEAFICDTRSERLPSQEHFMSEDQLEALKTWLADPSRAERIKPVFFQAPVLALQTEDTFWGYQTQMKDFLTFIQDENIKYVAFFTGDIHVGVTGLWKFEGEDGPLILEDASSALNKVAHTKDKLLKDSLDLREEGGPKLSTVLELSPIVTESLYTRVNLDHQDHKVQIIKRDRHGYVLMSVLYNLETGAYHNMGESVPYQVISSVLEGSSDEESSEVEEESSESEKES